MATGFASARNGETSSGARIPVAAQFNDVQQTFDESSTPLGLSVCAAPMPFPAESL
jgi:hypothetical protein